MNIKLIPDERISGLFHINDYKLRKARNGYYYIILFLTLEDNIIRGYIWEDHSGALKTLYETDLVVIDGKVKELYEQCVIIINSITPFKKDRVDVKDKFDRLIILLNSIENKYLKTLTGLFLDDHDFLKKFIEYPAGLHIHHNRYGGLLEHTVGVMHQSYLNHRIYKDVFDKDLLLAGAFLHDVGKVAELSQADKCSYTTEGRLLGHINLGLMMVDERISQIDGFPDELKLSIRHMIASHHGKINGSDVAPKTPEAILLHRMDGLDITMDKIRTQRCNGWSAYDEVLKTEVYFG